MKVLIAQSYFRPHLNGMISYSHRLAKGLIARGHEVTLVTARHSPELPPSESIDGIRVVRLPVWFRVGKVSCTPAILTEGAKWVAWSDIVNLHAPHEAAVAYSFIASYRHRKPLVLTYHCDLSLPAGLLNRAFERVAAISNFVVARKAAVIIHATQDYADRSPLLCRWREKLAILPPPVEVAPPDPLRKQALGKKWKTEGRPTIGFVGRFAHEKGLPTLLAALPRVAERIPGVKLLIAGPTIEVMGESLWNETQQRLRALGNRVVIVGILTEADMGSFYSMCDVIASPSDKPSEAFGLVQVEAMSCGVPVVVSEIRGMRVPVSLTGMGKLVPPGDPQALAEALVTVLEARKNGGYGAGEPARLFAAETIIAKFETLCFRALGAQAAQPS